jgi:hypothetical protein
MRKTAEMARRTTTDARVPQPIVDERLMITNG